MSGTIKFESALSGVRNGINNLQNETNKIASKKTMEHTGVQDLVSPLVNLKSSIQQISASAEVVKASDEMIGTLLDIKA